MEINIKAFEITAQAAKDFLQKVVTPPLEEIGGLLADHIKLFRLKNQVNILSNADEFIKQKGIKTRKVSLKVLTPMLEECSLEEDKSLQEKWTSLFINTVKEHSQINTTLYSHILGQMTTDDANLFQEIFDQCTLTHKSDGKQVSIKVDGKTFMKTSFHSGLVLDNLIRLRLIGEKIQYGAASEHYFLTDLGFNFMFAVIRE